MHELLKHIPFGHANAIARTDLASKMGVGDRVLRQRIQVARDAGAIILNRQDGRGYYLADPEDIEELQRQYRQDTARAMAILRRRKAIRRLLKEKGVAV